MSKETFYWQVIAFLIVVSFLALLSLSGSCTSPRALDVGQTYRKTLRFSVNGERATGTFSAKKKSLYDLEISVPQKPTLVKLTSCHQERIFQKPGKEIEYEYRPNPDIEAGALPCLLEMSALEESGKNQWGVINFQLPQENLDARVHCNGDVIKVNGSHICQSRVGLVQGVEFVGDVSSYGPEECNTIDASHGSTFYVNMTEGTCFYLFADSQGKLFRLVTFGYTEALLDD